MTTLSKLFEKDKNRYQKNTFSTEEQKDFFEFLNDISALPHMVHAHVNSYTFYNALQNNLYVIDYQDHGNFNLKITSINSKSNSSTYTESSYIQEPQALFKLFKTQFMLALNQNLDFSDCVFLHHQSNDFAFKRLFNVEGNLQSIKPKVL